MVVLQIMDPSTLWLLMLRIQQGDHSFNILSNGICVGSLYRLLAWKQPSGSQMQDLAGEGLACSHLR